MNALITFLLLNPTSSLAETLYLGLDTTIEVSAKGGAAILIDDGNLVSAKDLGNRIRIAGKKTGSTTIRIGTEIHKVTVATKSTFENYKKLKPIFEDLRGLKLELIPERVVIRGKLLRFDDWELIHDLAADQNIDFEFQSTIPDNLLSGIKMQLSDLAAAASLPPPLFETSRSSPLRIRVPKNQAALQQNFKSLYSPWGVPVIEDSSLVEVEPLVEVEILVAEVRRSGFQNLGIQWPSSYTAGLLPSTTSQLVLHALENNGLGRLLASPKLLCRSGKEANFFAGGEFPIKIMNFKINDVVWKKYGISLEIKPVADRVGQMSIHIQTEVSNFDPSRTVDGIPAMLTNRISSHFDVKGKQTIALSGLLKRENSRDQQGLPWLSNIPVLGALFSSRDYKEARTELVVFVTPSIVEGTAKPELPKDFQDAN